MPQDTCAFPHCTNRVKAVGLCVGHYKQRAKGQELRPLRVSVPSTAEELAATTCVAEGCDRDIDRRGLCVAHYRRMMRSGSVDSARPIASTAQRGEARAFFEAHVMEPSDGCRIWPFGTPHPRHYPNLKGFSIYRETCRMWNGDRPTDVHQAAHACGNTWCWAGEHLRWATPAENMGDKNIHGTALRGETSPNAKLTDTAVYSIRSDERPTAVIAADHGIAASTVRGIKRRDSWAHLPDAVLASRAARKEPTDG